MNTPAEIAAKRGKTVEEITGLRHARDGGQEDVKVTLVKSPIGTKAEASRTRVRGLGLRRLHQTVELEDTPAVRGMINQVSYLVRVEG